MRSHASPSFFLLFLDQKSPKLFQCRHYIQCLAFFLVCPRIEDEYFKPAWFPMGQRLDIENDATY